MKSTLNYLKMKKQVQQICTALNDKNIRYIIAGGLAVVAHGYLRLTMDVDLIIDMERENLLRALIALEKIGYQPRLSVIKEQFADQQIREKWINEKNMMMFPLWNPSDKQGIVIDIFVKCPFVFADEYSKVKWMGIEGVQVPFVSVECLLKMKAEAARPKDLVDIEYLSLIHISEPTRPY